MAIAQSLLILALEYTLLNYPNLIVEEFMIFNGDHEFLVIGRDLSSDFEKPETWGDNVYICDPWQNKVFLAGEYLSKVKNYYLTYHDIDGQTNYTEDFNPQKHALIPAMSYLNIQVMTSEDHKRTLYCLFQKKSALIISAFRGMQDDLNKIATRLLERYGARDEKYIIIKSKLDHLNEALSQVQSELAANEFTNENYFEFQTKFEEALRKHAKSLKNSTKIKQEEAQTLWRYNKGWATSLMIFFKIPPKTIRMTNNACQRLNEELSQLKDWNR